MFDRFNFRFHDVTFKSVENSWITGTSENLIHSQAKIHMETHFLFILNQFPVIWLIGIWFYVSTSTYETMNVRDTLNCHDRKWISESADVQAKGFSQKARSGVSRGASGDGGTCKPVAAVYMSGIEWTREKRWRDRRADRARRWRQWRWRRRLSHSHSFVILQICEGSLTEIRLVNEQQAIALHRIMLALVWFLSSAKQPVDFR